MPGMTPMRRYADGTSNVQIGMPFPQQAQNPNLAPPLQMQQGMPAPGLLPPAPFPPALNTVAPSDYGVMPAPPTTPGGPRGSGGGNNGPPGVKPGTSTPYAPPRFGAPDLTALVPGGAANPQAGRAAVSRGATVMQGNPNLPTLGNILDKAIQPGPGSIVGKDGTTRVVNDPTELAAAHAAAEGHPNQIGGTHAMLNPHQYTREQFLDETEGMPMATVEKLWGMQHYLTPEQQILPRYVQALSTQADRSKLAYEAAVKSGSAKAGDANDPLYKKSEADAAAILNFGKWKNLGSAGLYAGTGSDN